MADFGVAAGVVSGYWPLAGEIDVRPLMTRLVDLGFEGALPVVTAPGRPLDFRRWRPGQALIEGPFGTRHPEPGEPSLRPDIVLAPLLAFDDLGRRLGWGGGYYDRTFEALRRRGPVLAVGIAFAAQRVDTVPHAPHDRRMDWIVTEESWMKARP
jgi:5-formyltetrahydrofolate cyclo-ligase